jgi:dimethylhistidine N-methyltransferase
MIEAAADGMGASISLIEFGSGSSCKTRLLIEAALSRQERLEYVPIDISADFLLTSSLGLLAEYDRLSVTAIAAEYNDGIHAIPSHDHPRLILFLGSNIGNFEPSDAVKFLARVRAQMTGADRILIGADMLKDTSIIEAAYNDSSGVTETFNKNLLVRTNEELGGEFDLDSFEHRAPFVADKSRIEMWLMSRKLQTVAVHSLAREFSFAEGEGIHTEYSHKYTHGSIENICRAAGLEIQASWSDPRESFGVLLLKPRDL